MANPEGPVSTLVIDSAKHLCWRCNGAKFYYSKTIDDFNDVPEDPNVAIWAVTITGGSIQAEVLLCVQCGAQNIGNWFITDQIAAAAAAVFDMTNLDASVANGLAGLYLVYLDDQGTDTGLYYTIASNTAAGPTIITVSIATNNDELGGCFITRFLPVGLTAAS